MNKAIKKREENQDLTREVVIRRSYNSLKTKRITHSLVIDFARYIYAFLKDDNTLWFNFQNGVILEENNQRARTVFSTLTKEKKPKYINFSPKTHATFEKIKLSNKTLSYGAQIISLSQLKYLKNNRDNKDLYPYIDVIFDDQQFYMRPSPSEIIPLNTKPLPDGSGFSSYNNKGEEATFKRVKLFQIHKKITITK